MNDWIEIVPCEHEHDGGKVHVSLYCPDIPLPDVRPVLAQWAKQHRPGLYVLRLGRNGFGTVTAFIGPKTRGATT